MIVREVKIEKLIHRGLGLGYKDGRTIMAYYSIPGEVVDAEIIMTKKSYSICKTINIHERSSHRRQPECEYFRLCGGCQLMHIDYPYQVVSKVEILTEFFKRSRIRDLPQIKTILSRPDLYYRLRAQFEVRSRKVGFKKFKTDEFINIESCAICHNRINDAIKFLNGLIRTTDLNRLFIATDGKNVSTSPIKDLDKMLKLSIDSTEYILRPEVFFQANIYTAEEFIKSITRNSGGIFAIDLYAGSGFFSIPLSDLFENILAVEESAPSVSLLKKNITLNRKENIEILQSSVEKADIPKKYNNPDLIIVDPPRSGLSKSALSKVISLNPAQLIYVSCDPATLTRDVLFFYKNFYNIDEIILLDQFPHTFHFETIVKMRKISLNKKIFLIQ